MSIFLQSVNIFSIFIKDCKKKQIYEKPAPWYFHHLKQIPQIQLHRFRLVLKFKQIAEYLIVIVYDPMLIALLVEQTH